VKTIAIIPARGGSKRIPRKNIKSFFGIPIIAYSIKTALSSGLFDEVMVSTDDAEIKEIALKYGAKVPFMRSPENSNDYATTMDVIQEVLKKYNEKTIHFKYACCIYPTAPLIRPRHLSEGFDKLKANNLYTVFPMVEFSYPIWRGLEIQADGKTKMLWREYLGARSQDLTKVYHDAGQWYWLDVNNIQDSLFTENSGSLILSEEEVQDIDSLSDWKIAEMKYSILNES
jgi:pseudaminic acid cytidylyltransferase